MRLRIVLRHLVTISREPEVLSAMTLVALFLIDVFLISGRLLSYITWNSRIISINLPSCMALDPPPINLCLRLPFLHVTLCYLSHRRVRPKLYLQNKGALRTFFCLHTSQQPREFRGCSQKINMGDLIGNFADLPRTSQSESQPCFHINTHHRRKPIVELASLATGYGN